MRFFATKTERGDGDTLPLSSIARATHSVMRGPSEWQASETIITEKPYRKAAGSIRGLNGPLGCRQTCYGLRPWLCRAATSERTLNLSLSRLLETPTQCSLLDASNGLQAESRRSAYPLATDRGNGDAQVTGWAIFFLTLFCFSLLPTA